MNEAERQSERQSIGLIENYKKEEKKVYREIEKLKAEQTHERINFMPYQDRLNQKIGELQVGLMDIEIKVQQALNESRKQFFAHVTALNDEMSNDQSKLFADVNGKIGEFKAKLIEELNKEKDEFALRFEEED